MKKQMRGLDYKRKFEKGITLIEALVATVIVGIGFVSVFQMVQYSVQSIGVSSERTKANLLITMVAEDFISVRNSDSKTKGINFKDAFVKEQITKNSSLFDITKCSPGTSSSTKGKNAEENKIFKWKNRFSDRRLKCATKNDQTDDTNDTKKLEVFTYCSNQVASKTNLSNKSRPCMYTNNTRYSSTPSGRKERFYDERYFVRMEVGVTSGKMKTDNKGNKEPTSKKKYIYFQLD
jgi:Tfp pilus assembly protein PilV